jgi:peptidoglycan/xylan/chitin deacetylase (PgdA/CDA1 family)
VSVARSSARPPASLVVGALAVTVAVVAVTTWIGRGGDQSVDTSLAAGRTNPLAGVAPDDAAAPTVSPTSPKRPRVTVTAPAPMVLPAGPAAAISRVATTDRVIFLAIDDGLTRDPAVLDWLAAHQVPFTSFLVTSALEADPAYWARSREIGGTIQAHSITHPDLTKVSADQIRHELCGSADAIERATGSRPTLFRPPYGKYNATVQQIAWECGYAALAMWKGSTNDGRVDLQEGTLQPGDILLLHWRGDLLLNLQRVQGLARANGFRIARLEDYLTPVP